MKTLSRWAKQHPVQARWLIAVNRTLLGILGFMAGLALAENEVAIFKNTWLVSSGLFLAGYLFYPLVGKGIPGTRSFARRKTCDAMLVASSIFFYLAAGNFLIYEPVNSACQPVQIQAVTLYKAPPEKFIEKQHKTFKTWKKNVRNDLREIRRGAKGLDTWTVVLLVLATLAILYFLGGITVAAACSLSCNGQEGLASLVLIFGCSATIGLPVLMWRGAIRKRKQKELLQQKEQGNAEGDLVPASREIQVRNENLKVCLETEASDAGAVSIALQDQILVENAMLGSQPVCQDIQLSPGKIHRFSIQRSPGASSQPAKIKVTVEDGMVKKRFWLTLSEKQVAEVHFKIEGK